MKVDLRTLVIRAYVSGILYREFVRETKKTFVEEVLIACGGNQCKAARALGEHRNTVSRNIAELGIDMKAVYAKVRQMKHVAALRAKRAQSAPQPQVHEAEQRTA